MSLTLSSEKIKAEAHALGFFACGVAKAGPVSKDCAQAFRRWLDDGGHADMEYMARNTDKRLDPRLLVPGVKSIVSVALNYAPARRMPQGELQVAAYALGRDYHDIMKSRLHTLAANLGIASYRAFCDTAPVLERYWAQQAGVGWIGRNHQLIVCGTCRACMDACPTGALARDGSFNSSRCLSYLTIEHRGDIPPCAATKMGNTIYGCDRCQDACPWNRFATPTTDHELQARGELLGMTRNDWQNLTIEQYRTLFKGSAVKRAKYGGLMRNINCATEDLRVKN